MSDVRIPETVRLERATPNSGGATQVGTGTNPEATAAADGRRVLHATVDVSAPQARVSRPASDLLSLPLATPVSRLGSAGPDANAGVRSFIDNLHALDFESTNDPDSMTSAFLKLEVTNLSTNQDMERFINQAKHLLREAAMAVAKAQIDQTLLGRAGQLEQRAARKIREAFQGRPSERVANALDDMERANGGGRMTQQRAAESWSRVYDAAGRALRESAKASKEEKEAMKRGDHSAAADARQRAKDADSRARTMLEAARIKVSDPEALRDLALDMEASGDGGNVLTKYLEQHPEAAADALPAETLSQASSQGGQAIADALIADAATRAASGDAASTAALGRATNAATQQAVSEAQSELPADSPLRRTLASAQDMLGQADALRDRAVATQTGIDAAEKVLAEGRTDDGQFGVQRRNMVAQDEIMLGLTRLLGGTRPDQHAREEAHREARRAQEDVVQLLIDFVDRDHASSTRRVHPDRI